MDGPHEGPSETDRAHLVRTKAPSETDGAPSQKAPYNQNNTKYGLLESGHLRGMARSHMDGPARTRDHLRQMGRT